MKFDPFAWHEVKPNENYEAPQGRLRVLCSQAAPLYVSAVGVEALSGVGTSHDLEISGPVTFCVDAAPSVRVFVHMPRQHVHKDEGEVFTNPDRMPLESGTVLEIKRAVREFQLLQAAQLREMRQEAQQLRRERAKSAPKPVAPATAPDASPEAEQGAEE